MPNPADELALNIARNVVPLNAGQDIAGPYMKAEDAVTRLLRQLGLLKAPASNGYVPGLNEPLPQRDPATGQMVYPQGYKGPR